MLPRRLIFTAIFLGLAYAEGQLCTEKPEEDDCALAGNTDYYGLGVRMGIYASWLSSWFANNFLGSEIVGTLETNSIFLSALFATVFGYSLKKEGIRTVDVLVINQLCMGFVFSVMSLWGYRTMYYRTEGLGGRKHFGGIGTHYRLVLLGMISSYAVWFWVEGVQDGLPECDRRKDCGGLQTFFITPMNAEEWGARGINLGLSIGLVVYYGIMALAALAGGVAYISRRLRRIPVSWDLIPEADLDLTKRELSHWYIILSCFNLFWIVFSMVQIEFTLNLNHIDDVVGIKGLTGPGQLIPMGIGLISLARVVYVIITEEKPWRKQDKDECRTPIVAPGTTGRPRRSFLHRFLLAWLPWLALFDFWKQPITPSLHRLSYPMFGMEDVDVDAEPGMQTPTPGRSKAAAEKKSMMQSSEMALLTPPPNYTLVQDMGMATTNGSGIPLTRRSTDLDTSIYAGNEYGDD
ncbi:hypothetical protein EDD37DRAFT_650930 [Exophiala viscosa]|nr:hypothetical protein EDD37DRAFT_650930 [Exophiala viscosa]